MTNRAAMTDARLDAIGIVNGFINHDSQPDDDVVTALIRTSEHEPWQLLVALAGVTAAMVEQFAPVYGIITEDYLNRLRQWVLADRQGGDDRMSTIGTQLAQPDPRGWLVFDSLDNASWKAEDSTQQADYDRAHRHNAWDPIGDITPPWGRYSYPPRPNDPQYRPHGVWFTRHATPTERELLTHLGFTLPAELFTVVTYDTAIRNRRWPQLETEGTPT